MKSQRFAPHLYFVLMAYTHRIWGPLCVCSNHGRINSTFDDPVSIGKWCYRINGTFLISHVDRDTFFVGETSTNDRQKIHSTSLKWLYTMYNCRSTRGYGDAEWRCRRYILTDIQRHWASWNTSAPTTRSWNNEYKTIGVSYLSLYSQYSHFVRCNKVSVFKVAKKHFSIFSKNYEAGVSA